MKNRTFTHYTARDSRGDPIEIIRDESGVMWQLGNRCGLMHTRARLLAVEREVCENSPYYFEGDDTSTAPAALNWLAEQLDAGGDPLRVHITSKPGYRNYFEAWAGVIVGIDEDNMILVDLEVPGRGRDGGPVTIRRSFFSAEIRLT